MSAAVDLHLRLPRLAGGGRLLRARPPPDELPGHRRAAATSCSAAGMAIAVVATLIYLLTREGGLSATALAIIVVGFLIGGGAGLYTARTVKMTAMPQLVSLFNAVGGGAAALVAIDDFIRLNSGAPARHDDLRRPRRAHRLGHVHRLADRRRQAPGPHPGQADLRPGWPARHDRARARRAARDRGPDPGRGRRRSCSSSDDDAGAPGRRRAGRPDLRRHDGPADRRRRHAGRHQPAELVHRHGRGDGRLRHRQPGADHRRRPRRRVRRDPDQAHGRRHEPLDHEHHGRRVRWRRRGRGRGRRGRRHGPRDRRRRRGDPAGLRPVGDHRARLRPRRRPGPARGPRAGRAARGARRRRQVRHPSRRRPDAGAHERPARRGQRALSAAQGDGGDQPRVRPRPTWPSSSAPTT